MANIGYARVSTVGQDLELQIEALQSAGCDEIFSGKQSGVSDENERKLTEMLAYIRKGDIVFVTKIDRLGRSLKSILTTIDRIHGKDATLRSLDGAIDTSNNTPIAKATIALLGVFGELERDLIVGRTTEGRERAKAQGKHMGRPPQIGIEARAKIRSALKDKGSISAVARQFAVSRTTVRRIRDEGVSL
jgi:DNA invertase Pin-like site-specific DNA recombinase